MHWIEAKDSLPRLRRSARFQNMRQLNIAQIWFILPKTPHTRISDVSTGVWWCLGLFEQLDQMVGSDWLPTSASKLGIKA